MKILQINKLYYPVVGGIETIVKQTAEGINNRDGFTVDVLVCNNRFRTTHETVHGVSVTRASSIGIFLSMPVSISFILLLRKLWRRYDVLHVHLPFPLAEIALWLIRPDRKIIVTYHSDIVRQRLISRTIGWLHRWVLGHAEKIAVSNPSIIETSPLLKQFKTKCEVIPFGADITIFNPDSGAKHRIDQIQKDYGKKIVLFVGRLVYYKGLEYLIRAMKGIDARLVLIGEGPLRKILDAEIEKQGLGHTVAFIPYQSQEELVDFYRASRVFVLPSVYRSEAFGITIIEAMACGLPVISTELGTGTSYANRDGITGYVVPPRDSAAINRALKKLLSDSILWSKMGNAAFDRIRQGFTVDNMMDGYRKLYKNSNHERHI
jgi:rhamnosyl/mannosyltransferase